MKQIIIFGHGYVSQYLSRTLITNGWIVYGTSRDPSKFSKSSEHLNIIDFESKEIDKVIRSSDAILSTIAPSSTGEDPVLAKYQKLISHNKYKWVGYLSSTGVYGDHKGAWVNENTVCTPTNIKDKERLQAEQAWLSLTPTPSHIFRLSGIYGPQRNCLENIKQGKDFSIKKEGQYFSRIHVEDISQAIIASINKPTPGEIFNITDSEPEQLHIVQEYGASLLGYPRLKEITLEKSGISEAGRRFFQSNRKVSNQKATKRLNIKWKYPSYHSGLLEGCLPHIKSEDLKQINNP